MAEPLTPGFIAAQCALGMVKGAVGKGAAAGAMKVIAAFRERRTPEGLELLKATHTAFLRALRMMAAACAETGGSSTDHFSAQALESLAYDPEFERFEAAGALLDPAELEQQLRALLVGDRSPGPADAVMAEIEKRIGHDLTPAHRELFRYGNQKHRCWADAFQLFFADMVAQRESIFRAFAFERLNAVLAYAQEHRFEISALRGRVETIHRDLRSGFKEMRGEMAELRRAISAEAGVPLATLEAIAGAFGELQPNADLDTLERYLRTKAEEYHSYRERAETIAVRDNIGRVLLDRAQAAVDAGDFEEADSILAEAEAYDEDVARELRLTADQRDRDRSSKRALRGDAARLKGDYRSAIAHYDAAVEMLPPDALELRHRLWRAAAAAAETQAERVDPLTLKEAVERWRQLAAETPREPRPSRWANAQNDFGRVLALLGEREKGTKTLKEAITTFQAALEVVSAEDDLALWIRIQNNLGNAVASLGIREAHSQSLRSAVSIFRSILESGKLDNDPFAWSTAQGNLANVLFTLGERQPGTETLEASVQAARMALAASSREDRPQHWATMQNTLGNALFALGEREEGIESFRLAIAAYEAGLELRTRKRAPILWAMMQNNLGGALGGLGARENDIASLRMAISAFQAALEVRTRKDLPLYWAMTRSNLGVAMLRVGELEKDGPTLELAAAAFRDACEVYDRDTAPFQWAITQNNLGGTLLLLANITNSCPVAVEAVAVLEGVVEAFSSPDGAQYQAGAQANLAQAETVRSRVCREA